MSSAKAAARYIERGYAVVPVPAGSKNPGRAGWEGLRITLEDVPRYFDNGQNIGIHVGEPSGWRVDVDLDASEARRVAGRFLEPTLTSGRASSPDSHWWFVCPGAAHRTFKDLTGEMILELRSTGHHTLVWPSVHPSGEEIRWSEGGLEAQEIGAEDLVRACRELASAGLIARHLPPPKDKRSGAGGGRHDIALALAGFLLRRGLDEQTVLKILRAAWDARGFAGDQLAQREAHRDLEGLVRDTAGRILKGEAATGGRKLDSLVSGLPGKLADYWGWGGRLDDEGAFNLTDLGNAGRLIHRHGRNLRYCWRWSEWLVWDGRRWARDDTGEVYRLAKDTVASIYKEAAAAPDDETRKALAKHAVRSESGSRIKEMVDLARSDVPVRPEELDASPEFLNTANGTIDLRSGELREHRQEDLITKLAPTDYDPGAAAPLWNDTLERVLPSPALREFFRKLCGYALTGDTSEHVLPVLYGTGANGKSTVLNALLSVVGDYGMQAAPDLLIAKKGSHPTELADLFGMRFVASIEVEDGRRLAESLVKQLTGGDRVKARRMRQDFWEFEPTHTVFMAVNHKPIVRGTDTAIWRRIRLIPFEQTIPPADQDKQLPAKLRAEMPGILAWAVAGCLTWRREGLQAPEEVRKATAGYRSEMDVIGDFMADRCYRGERLKVGKDELYKAYQMWCEDAGERAESKRKFGMLLKDRGIEDGRNAERTQRIWKGVGLSAATRSVRDEDDGGDVSGGEFGADKRETGKTPRGTGHKTSETHINTKNSGPRGVNGKPVSEVSEVSEEQERRIRKLVHEGMAEKSARAAVLGKCPHGVPKGYPCDDCDVEERFGGRS